MCTSDTLGKILPPARTTWKVFRCSKKPERLSNNPTSLSLWPVPTMMEAASPKGIHKCKMKSVLKRETIFFNGWLCFSFQCGFFFSCVCAFVAVVCVMLLNPRTSSIECQICSKVKDLKASITIFYGNAFIKPEEQRENENKRCYTLWLLWAAIT